MYRQLLLVIVATVGVSSAVPSRAQCPPKCGPLGTVIPPVTLQITEPAPSAPLLEHSLLEIPYTVTLAPGVGGAAPVIDMVVCGADALDGGPCDIYDQVQANWTSPAGSKLRLRAPNAGSSVSMRVVACTKKIDSNQVVTCGGQLADKSFERPISARFMVRLDSFTILSTRSRHADTVYLALEGIFSGEHKELLDKCDNVLATPTVKNLILCKGATKFGTKDLGHGTYSVPNMTVGEFEVIPGRSGALTFGFVVFNYGFVVHPIILTGDMGGIVQNTIAGQLLTTDQNPSDDFVHGLQGEPWLGCDGPTAAGAVRLFNVDRPDSLDAVTRSTGAFSQQSKTYVAKSQLGCGDDSRYSVQWTVRRTSW